MGDIQKAIEIVLSTVNKDTGEFGSAILNLPAGEKEIREVIQRLQTVGKEIRVWSSILECTMFRRLEDLQLDAPTVDEMNFFAKRLMNMTDEEKIVFDAVIRRMTSPTQEIRFVGMKELINSTYGLNEVPIASNIPNLDELGHFVFENDMNSDISGISEEAVPYLDFKRIGQVQQENDDGVFVGSYYVVLREYERPEVYDGHTLPKEEATEIELIAQNLLM